MYTNSTLGSNHAQMQPTTGGDQGPEVMGKYSVLWQDYHFGVDHDGFATLHFRMLCMYKDPDVGFLMETFVQTIQY